MNRVARAIIIDGFVDEPACLGVPPYLSPQVRAAAGAALDSGAEVSYLTIDQIRQGARPPAADISLVMAGTAVPGKYLRAMPASGKEVSRLSEILPGLKVLGGPATLSCIEQEGGRYDVLAKNDPAAVVHDILCGEGAGQRWRTIDEWNRWLLLGAKIAKMHPDYPQPLIAEIETYRGCPRFASGGCSFCVEPLKGRPAFRGVEDIIEEVRTLHDLGVRNFRLGAQTCIISYMADMDAGDPPRPNPVAIERLFSSISSLGVDVLHVDNANPAVIATYPDESRAILKSLAKYCTSGNVLALGMESADPEVITRNNLNATQEQVMTAVRTINEEGRETGENGLPRMLPGINIIVGLDGETDRTLDLDMRFLQEVMAQGLLLRRINIRQVSPVRRKFKEGVDRSKFIKFKQAVRETIDRPMLQKLAPQGAVLRKVYTEIRDGKMTFCRQIGSYPLLIGVPYPMEIGRFIDVKVVGWGYRSITAVEHPLLVNSCPLSALEELPGLGRKRAIRLFMKRPMSGPKDLEKALDDASVAEGILPYLSFERPL